MTLDDRVDVSDVHELTYALSLSLYIYIHILIYDTYVYIMLLVILCKSIQNLSIGNTLRKQKKCTFRIKKEKGKEKL